MKTMTYSKQQLDFIEKVNKAQAYMSDNNALIGDVFTAYSDLLACDWWTQTQRPYLQKTYNRLHKQYGYVDKKLFAKVIWNILVLKLCSCDEHIKTHHLQFIQHEWKYTSTLEKIAVCYAISKTFRKTRGAK